MDDATVLLEAIHLMLNVVKLCLHSVGGTLMVSEWLLCRGHQSWDFGSQVSALVYIAE